MCENGLLKSHPVPELVSLHNVHRYNPLEKCTGLPPACRQDIYIYLFIYLFVCLLVYMFCLRNFVLGHANLNFTYIVFSVLTSITVCFRIP